MIVISNLMKELLKKNYKKTTRSWLTTLMGAAIDFISRLRFQQQLAYN